MRKFAFVLLALLKLINCDISEKRKKSYFVRKLWRFLLWSEKSRENILKIWKWSHETLKKIFPEPLETRIPWNAILSEILRHSLMEILIFQPPGWELANSKIQTSSSVQLWAFKDCLQICSKGLMDLRDLTRLTQCTSTGFEFCKARDPSVSTLACRKSKSPDSQKLSSSKTRSTRTISVGSRQSNFRKCDSKEITTWWVGYSSFH